MPDTQPRRLTERERRRLAEVFGDVLPVTTADERDDGDAVADELVVEDDLVAERPPHHDRER